MPDIWYPGAIRKPITANKGRDPLTVWNRLNLHIAVSEASSLFSYFNQSGIPDSHLYLRRDGTFEQYVPFNMQAFADLEGNDATVSVETQGMGTGTWTAEQRESLAQLYAWLVENYGIARKMATSSKTGTESKGLSWHRLGIDGNFPALPSILAGRLQRGGGMHYSTSAGKGCPTDDRIEQIPGIYNRALVILDGAPTQEDDMALTADDKADIRTIVAQELAKALGSATNSVEIDVPSNLVPYLGASATRDSIIRTGAARAEMARVAASQ